MIKMIGNFKKKHLFSVTKIAENHKKSVILKSMLMRVKQYIGGGVWVHSFTPPHGGSVFRNRSSLYNYITLCDFEW